MGKAEKILPLGDPVSHYWLAQRMARAVGVDLARASAEQRLSQEDWAAMVTRCRGCGWLEGCTRWLDRPQDEPRDIPPNCVNRDCLANLEPEDWHRHNDGD